MIKPKVMSIGTTEQGTVVRYKGKFWGIVYADGRVTEYGWVDIKEAELGDTNYCHTPSSFVYEGSHDTEEINKGELVEIIRTTSYREVDNG